ncbi:hypothetical protein SETIT_6G082300v2 [Setaria italica]|uniref:Uncharacterized protein n=1 Tax=Setaria italica TaxID=4555 RepID=A0A368RJB3_SETIT|nr:hypothetical protein SETIT_6G082300v2 [Setaria italica]
MDIAKLLAAAAAAAGPRAALAASGGSMGGSSSSDSSSSTCDFSSSDDSWWSSSPSSSPSGEEEGKEATHESVGTAPVELSPAAKRRHDMVFWGGIALASAALVLAALHHDPPTTTVVKLQVALRGVAAAKSFQKDLNKIAEKVQASDQRWYKFILTETIRSLRRHKDSCISSSLSADVKDYRKEHFNKISIEERSKFDEETFSNLDGIKSKRSYSRKTGVSKNEYTVSAVNHSDRCGRSTAVPRSQKLCRSRSSSGKAQLYSCRRNSGYSCPVDSSARERRALRRELKEDYPYLKPLRDD